MALSMRSALGSVFSRQRARFQSERIDPEDDRSPAVAAEQENDLTLVHDDTTPSTVRRPTAIMVADDDDEGEAQRHQEQRRHESFGSEEIQDIENQSLRSDEGEEEEDDDDNPMVVETIPAAPAGQQQQQPTIVSLAELEEERELARRRSSACVLLAVFVLFRLWVEAIQDADFGLLLLCLVGTSWTARWIRHLRDREEELDRRIAAYSSAAANAAERGNGEGSGGLVDRNELRMLSFQAQLALAIMESQRQMMQGGYGHPDGTDGAASSGVSDDARARWKTVPFTSALMGGGGGTTGSKQEGSGGYGSLVADGGGKNTNVAGLGQDAPHCSICLSEYEEGEGLIQLPCGHYYHEECINSWTLNHVKCPLCNFDLESVSGTTASASTLSTTGSTSTAEVSS